MGDAKPLVLVTGSSGLIGTRLVEAFAPDFRVVGLDVKEPEALPEGADFVECDLTRDEGVAASLDRVRERHGDRVASVLHLAAYVDFSGDPSPLYRSLTVEGTSRLLRGLRERFRVEQLVFSSTLLVMKPAAEDEVLTESSPLEGEWEYPRSKIETERRIAAEHGDVPVVILRLAGVYDEGCHSPPLAQHISRIREKQLESILFPGNAEHGQPFLHIEDAVVCFRAAVAQRDALERWEIFLVAEPGCATYAELQDRIGERVHGREWPTIRVPAPLAKVGAWAKDKLPGETFIKPWMVDQADAHYPVSIQRARERLRWTPKHDLLRTLPEMVRRLEQDPEGWYAENGLDPEDAR